MDIIIVVAPTGAGKNYLLKNIADIGFRNAVSHTTRKPRDGEIDGEDYYFIDKETFDTKKDMDQFIETINFGGPDYGLTSGEIKEIIGRGNRPYIIVEPNGLEQILDWFNTYVKDSKNCRIQVVYLDIPRHIRYRNILTELKYLKTNDKIINLEIAIAARNRINRNGDNIKTDMEKYLLTQKFSNIFDGENCFCILVHIDSKKLIDKYIELLHDISTSQLSVGISFFRIASITDSIGKNNYLKFNLPNRPHLFYKDSWEKLEYNSSLKFYISSKIKFVAKYFDLFYKNTGKLLDQESNNFEMVEIDPENIPLNIVQETKVRKKRKRWYQIQIINSKVRVRVYEENDDTNLNFNCPIVTLIMEDGLRLNNPTWVLNLESLNIPRYNTSGAFIDTASVILENPNMIETFISIMKAEIYDNFNNQIKKLKDERNKYRKLKIDSEQLESYKKYYGDHK